MTHGPKSKSKRVTLRLKFNIAKKAKEKRRKMKKLAKQHPELVPRKSKKDPGIPNLWPFKEALLEKAERQKAKLDEEQQRQREARKAVLDKKRKAVSKDAEVRAISASIKAPEMKNNDKSAQRSRWYMRDLKKVVEKADVILEVLDARDPLGCRCLAVERMIQGAMSEKSAKQKKIILVLNKIDLVPAEVVQAWVKYLRREFPVVAFKASTQKQGSHLSASNAKLSDVAKDEDILKTSASVGAHALIELLKKYSLSINIKTAISVGIIGYPNVGKSSVINSLKRSKAVGVGSTPGLTKSVTMVRLDKHIELLDSPGVLFDAEQSESDLVLRNALKVEQVEDPVMAVAAVVEKCSPEALMEVYKVPAFSDADEFLMHIGIKKGKLGKGGVPEIKAAARAVLRDWNEGKIPYYTVPPEIKVDVAEDAKIVSDWSKSIDVDKLLEETNTAALSGLKSVKEAGAFMQFKASQPSNTDLSAMDSDDEDYGVLGAGRSAMEAKEHDEEEEEEEEDGAADMPTDEPMGGAGAGAGGKRIVIDTAKAFKKEEKKQPAGSQAKKLASPEDLLNPTTNRDMKKAAKKNKKAERKQKKRSEAGPADMDDENDGDQAQDIEEEEESAPVQIKAFNPDDDSYDFDRDFGA